MLAAPGCRRRDGGGASCYWQRNVPGLQGVRIDGLDHQQPAGTQLPEREAKNCNQLRVRKVLNDLGGEHNPE